jgi:hypothetical protein
MRTSRWKTSTFMGCLAAMAIVWGWILPRLATFDAVRSRIDTNRKAGINPTAVFYTDHPTMPDIENRIENRIGARPSAPRPQPSPQGSILWRE